MAPTNSWADRDGSAKPPNCKPRTAQRITSDSLPDTYAEYVMCDDEIVMGGVLDA
jgi:hypothetical protein